MLAGWVCLSIDHVVVWKKEIGMLELANLRNGNYLEWYIQSRALYLGRVLQLHNDRIVLDKTDRPFKPV